MPELSHAWNGAALIIFPLASLNKTEIIRITMKYLPDWFEVLVHSKPVDSCLGSHLSSRPNIVDLSIWI